MASKSTTSEGPENQVHALLQYHSEKPHHQRLGREDKTVEDPLIVKDPPIAKPHYSISEHWLFCSFWEAPGKGIAGVPHHKEALILGWSDFPERTQAFKKNCHTW
jgi:hypothetical protein